MKNDPENVVKETRQMKVLSVKSVLGFLLGLWMLMGGNLQAQEADSWLWTGVGLKVPVTQQLRFDFEEQLRMEDNLTGFQTLFTEAAVNYRPVRFLSANVNYRHMIRDGEDKYRIATDLLAHHGKPQLQFKYRLRFQSIGKYAGGPNADNLRFQITTSTQINENIQPFVQLETFYRLNDVNCFKVFRPTVGIKWKWQDHHQLLTYYNYQRELNADPWSVYHMFVIRYSYTLNRKG